MEHLNKVINNNFGVILFFASLTGLIIPQFQININLTIIIALAFIIFVSYFNVNLDKTLIAGDHYQLLAFFIGRFIALPAIVYYVLTLISDYYAIVMFLLLLLPAAVSSPAFANMFNGNIGLALKTMVVTSFVSIFTMPLLCKFVLGGSISLNTTSMFLTMVYTIVLPFVLHLPFKKNDAIKRKMSDNSPLLTIIGLATIYMLATSKNRAVILSDPYKVIWYLTLSVAVFLILYVVGFYLFPQKLSADKISYSICSGANNVGLGVTITALFFPQEINTFFITAQLAWIAALIPIRYFFYKKG